MFIKKFQVVKWKDLTRLELKRFGNLTFLWLCDTWDHSFCSCPVMLAWRARRCNVKIFDIKKVKDKNIVSLSQYINIVAVRGLLKQKLTLRYEEKNG